MKKFIGDVFEIIGEAIIKLLIWLHIMKKPRVENTLVSAISNGWLTAEEARAIANQESFGQTRVLPPVEIEHKHFLLVQTTSTFFPYIFWSCNYCFYSCYRPKGYFYNEMLGRPLETPFLPGEF